MSLFERYSEPSRRAIFFSLSEACTANSAAIQPEHILLGMLVEQNERLEQLFQLRSRYDQVVAALNFPPDRKLKQPPKGNSIPLAGISQMVLAWAVEEADDLGHARIDVEHLMLGLLRAEENKAAVVLRSLGIEYTSARKLIAAALPHNAFKRWMSKYNVRKCLLYGLLGLVAAWWLVVIVRGGS